MKTWYVCTYKVWNMEWIELELMKNEYIVIERCASIKITRRYGNRQSKTRRKYEKTYLNNNTSSLHNLLHLLWSLERWNRSSCPRSIWLYDGNHPVQWGSTRPLRHLHRESRTAPSCLLFSDRIHHIWIRISLEPPKNIRNEEGIKHLASGFSKNWNLHVFLDMLYTF